MKLFSRLLAFVFGGAGMVEHHTDASAAPAVPREDKLETLETALRLVVRELKEKEERIAALQDRETVREQHIASLAARAEALEKLVQELMATRSKPVEEPEPIAVSEEALLEAPAPEEVPAATTQPEPETVPEEPPTPTVEPVAVEEAAAAATEVVEVTVVETPIIPKVVVPVEQWFRSPTEGRRWHLERMESGVQLALQGNGTCSFPSCGEPASGAHLDLRDGHGIFPVCAYGHAAAATYRHKHKKAARRPMYWANDEQLERFKTKLQEAIDAGELKRLVAEAAAKEQAAAEAQAKEERLHAMEIVIRQDLFQAGADDSCSVPNCNDPAPVKCLYPDLRSQRRMPLCDGHAADAEALRLEQKRKPKRLRLPFWVFLTQQNENIFLTRQTNQQANDEVARREREEKRREWEGWHDLKSEAAEEKATQKQLRQEARGRQSHTRIKAVQAADDKKPGDPRAAA